LVKYEHKRLSGTLRLTTTPEIYQLEWDGSNRWWQKRWTNPWFVPLCPDSRVDLPMTWCTWFAYGIQCIVTFTLCISMGFWCPRFIPSCRGDSIIYT